MAGIKVGEGYIEITPKIIGITQELRRKAQVELNKWDDVKFSAAPKITGITKKWQTEVQRALNKEINGLTVNVAVKLDKSNIKATFGDITIEAKNAGDKAGDGLSDGFRDSVNDIRRMMDEVKIAIQSGITPERNGDIENRLGEIDASYRQLAENIDDYSDREVAALRSGISQMEALQNRVSSTIQKESNAVKKANDDLEKEIRRTINETDKLVLSTRNSQNAYANNFSKILAGLSKDFKAPTESIRTEFAKITPVIQRTTNDSLVSMDKFNRGIFNVEKTVKQSFKESTEKGFNEAASIIQKFAQDNGITLAKIGSDAGKSFGGSLSEAVSTTFRFGLARMIQGLPLILAGFSYALGPISAAIQNLAAGFTLLAGQAAYAAGALLALPAAMGAVLQGAGVLTIAFQGIQEALSALQAEELQSSKATDTFSDQMEAAATRVADARRTLAEAQTDSADRIATAEESMARTVEASAERISEAQARITEAVSDSADRVTEAQDRLAEAQAQAAARIATAQTRLADAQADATARISDAQARLADVIASSSERISAAEESLSRTREDAADRIAEAQDRVASAYEDGARRVSDAERDNADALRDVTKAQESLTQAREDARERLEDLANSVASGKLSEEAAQFALEDARKKLEGLQIDPNATDDDKAKADLDYREALQRLKEIQEKNGDLAEEQAKADKDGVEGSKEVQDAKDDIADAIRKQMDAEQDLADARKEANDSAIAAERDLQKAREDAARSVGDAEKNLTDARTDAAKQIAAAEKDLTDSRIEAAKKIQEAEQAIIDARLQGSKDVANAEEAIVKAREDGAKRVAEAEKALEDARKQGSRDIVDAEKAIADARADGVRQVESATRSLAEAMAAVVRQSDNQSTAFTKAEALLAKLPPAGREFVYFIRDELIPKFQEVQDAIQTAFLPPLTAALRSSEGLFELMKGKLTDTATIFGDFTTDFFAWLNTDETKNSVGKIMDNNNRIFKLLGPAAISAIDGIKTLVEESGPFLLSMAGKVKDIATKFQTWMDKAKEDGTLQEFFRRTDKAIGDILEIIGHVGIAFGGILDAAWEPGQKLMETIKKAAKEFSDWATSIEGKNQLKKWFEDGRLVMEELGRLISAIVKEFLKLGTDVDLTGFLTTLRTDLLPALIRFFKVFTGDNGDGLTKIVETAAIAIDTLRVSLGLLAFALPPGTLGLDGLKESALKSINPFKDMGGSAEASGKQIEDAAGTMEYLAKKLGNDMPGAIAVYKDILANEGKAAADKWKETYEKITKNSLDIKTETGKNITGMVTEQKLTQGQLQKNSEDTWAAIHKVVVDKSSKAKIEGSGYISDFATNTKNSWTGINKDTTIQSAAFVTTVKEKTGSLAPVGESAVQGFWNGIMSRWNDLIKWWNENLGGLATLAQRILEVNSPSKVMARIGDSVGEGLALGITRSMGLAVKATAKMSKSVVSQWGAMSLPIGVDLPGVARSPSRSASGQMMFNTQPVSGGATTVNNLTLNAVPTIPTERQLLSVLSYADQLYK